MSRFNNVFKKVGLIALGVGAIGIVGLGIKSTVNYFKNDTKTLHLSYEVGNLGTDGKYVNDELALYSNKFACEGLRVSFDFDAEVNGQFAFYDINDKYLSKTDVITEGTSVDIPLNGAYARAVVIPTNDEDEKISFTEKYKYGSQMQVKVNKKAETNVEKKFKMINATLFEVKSDIATLEYKYDYGWDVDTNTYVARNSSGFSTTFNCLLDISAYKKISIEEQSFSFISSFILYDENMNFIGVYDLKQNSGDLSINVKNASYCIVNMFFNDEDMAKNPLTFLQLLKFEK